MRAYIPVVGAEPVRIGAAGKGCPDQPKVPGLRPGLTQQPAGGAGLTLAALCNERLTVRCGLSQRFMVSLSHRALTLLLSAVRELLFKAQLKMGVVSAAAVWLRGVWQGYRRSQCSL